MSSEGGQAIGPREGRLGLTLTKAAAQMCCRTLVFSPRPDEHECKSCGQTPWSGAMCRSASFLSRRRSTLMLRRVLMLRQPQPCC